MKKKNIIAALILAVMVCTTLFSVPALADSRDSNWTGSLGNHLFDWRAKDNTSSLYVYAQHFHPGVNPIQLECWTYGRKYVASSNGYAQFNPSLGSLVYPMSGKQYLIRTTIKEQGGSFAQLGIMSKSAFESVLVHLAWSPDSTGSYTYVN